MAFVLAIHGKIWGIGMRESDPRTDEAAKPRLRVVDRGSQIEIQ